MEKVVSIIDGRMVSTKLLADLKVDIQAFTKQTGRAPGLGTLLVGLDPASEVYIKMKRKACREAGILSVHKSLPDTATIEDVLQATQELVDDVRVDGVLVQMPLPNEMDENRVIEIIPPEKDVDGFNPFNIGRLASNLETVAPCTPNGIMSLLKYYDVDIKGKIAVVVGRSKTVGMPMAMLLLNHDATVVITHTETEDLASETSRADILVSATGHPHLITKEMVKPGAVVIDVGITRTDNGLVGDVDFKEVKDIASLITPVPGGVGPMTIATLLQTTLDLARIRG